MRRWAANRLTVGARQSGSLGSPTRVTRRHQSSLAQVTSPGKRASKAFPSADNHDKRPQPSSSKQKTSSPQSATSATVDPYELLAPELLRLRKTLLKLLGSSHPSLTKIAEYYFLQPSKQIRPLLVLLFARATNGLGGDWDEKLWATEHENARGREEELDYPLSRPDVLNDWNPNMPGHTASFDSTFDLLPPWSRGAAPMYPATRAQETPSPSLTDAPLLPTQVRLAQIVEMIHVASLLHDDVIDKAALRRSAASAPAAFGNKLSVLAGNFLLGRASAALSRLNSSETIELISSVISNLVEGEILQMKAAVADCAGDTQTLSKLGLVEAGLIQRVPVRGTSVNRQMWNIYLHKSYLKTASLIAKSARAAVVLGGAREGEIWKEVAYAYGRNIGIAFQLVDDVLDYEAVDSQLGKPGGADLQLGLTTGPALFAWEEHEAMGPLIARKFADDGDVEAARDLVRRSAGVERTRALAQAHADKAREVLQHLPESAARSALETLAERVVKRTS